MNSSARLPIARHIANGGDGIHRYTVNREGDLRDNIYPNAVMRYYTDDAILFDIQVAQDTRNGKANSDFNPGPLHIPFDRCWMEWEVPGVDDDGPGFRMGCSVEAKDGTWFDLLLVTVEPTTNLPVITDGRLVQVYLNGDSTFRSWRVSVHDHKRLWEDYPDPTLTISDSELAKYVNWQEPSEWLARTLMTPLTALGLINCKNVEFREAGRIGIRRSGAEKRRGIPEKTLRYNTILLPGSGSIRKGKAGEGYHRATAVHRVRGHFKTFTAERPLLGQHVGTYWWGWQVRGNPEVGEVQSDYRLADQ